MKYLLTFLVLVLVLGANLPDNVVARLGISSNYFTAALFAWIIAALIAHRKMAIIVLVLFMAIGANLPSTVAMPFQFDRDILFAGLIAVSLTPLIAKLFE